MSAHPPVDVLLVEDCAEDALLLRLMMRRLGDAGVLLRWVQSLAGARAAMAEQWPDVALLDLTLPDSLGALDALHQLRADAPTLPIVVLSGSGVPDIDAQVHAAGAQGFFAKGSLDATALVAVLRSAMGRRARLLADMRANYESLVDVVERSGDGVLVVQGTHVCYANLRAAVMFGCSRETLLERPPPWSTGTIPAEVSILRDDGQHGVGEIRLSQTVWQGREARLVVVRDVSRARAVEQVLHDREKSVERAHRMEAVGLLAGGVAHEFNNQLMVIQGFTELALHTIDQPGRAREHLQRVIDATQHAADITRQLMSLSRRPSQPSQPTRLAPLLAEARRLLAPLLGETIHLQIEVPPALEDVHVLLAAGELQQVLMNLAINARDAMPGGGTLELGLGQLSPAQLSTLADAGQAWVRLWVRDTGIGMDEATQAHAFEPFFTTKEVGEGTGLGLSTVYGLTQRWQGQLHLVSAPGEGTIVTLLLPCCAVSEHAAASPSGGGGRTEALTGTETLLVVEDEVQVRDYLRIALSRRGFQVCTAAEPQAALAQLLRQDVDALILDVVMPGMTGPALVEELRARGMEPRVVYISGYPHRQAAAQIQLAPHVAFLQKPLQEEALVRAIRQVLAAPLPGSS